MVRPREGRGCRHPVPAGAPARACGRHSIHPCDSVLAPGSTRGRCRTARGSGRRGLAVGGGATGVIVVIVLALLGVDVTGGGGGSDPLSLGTARPRRSPSELSSTCRTGSDANQREDCRIVGVVNSVQAYWTDQINGYREAPTRFFSGQTSTGCGAATADVGPFYCPATRRVYIDLSFYGELRTRFGAKGGPFAEAYVIAHEYGHHVQHLLGTDDRVGNDREGAQSGSVRLELQADCYAGVWAAHAVDTGFIEELTQADITDGLDAAAAVGDDRIQQQATGRVDPETWTHGSPPRARTGSTPATAAATRGRCDTFAAGAV